MKFKAPRDPNTKVANWKIRDAEPGELCQVGSGECPEQAVEVQDNGEGREFRICAAHLVEMEALEKLIAEMTPDQIAQFDALVTAAHGAERKESTT